MKYAILILVICVCVCGCLAYRLGRSDCRADRAEVQLKVQQVAIRNDREIQQMVMSIPDDTQLEWLLSNYRRAD